MNNIVIAVLLTLFAPQTQVLTIKQTDDVLKVSVLLRVKQYIVNPETQEIKRIMGGCSGTYIRPETILTAAHCFSNPVTDIWVRDMNGPSLRASLIKLDPEKDLALIGVPGPINHAYAHLAKRVRVGEQVINVGSPFMFQFLVSEGVISALNVTVTEFKAHYTITTAMINPGSSGGGAFNEKGELIGVNTMTIGGFMGWAGISMTVDEKTVKAFLTN